MGMVTFSSFSLKVAGMNTMDTFSGRVALAQDANGWPIRSVKFLRAVRALWEAGKIDTNELVFLQMIVCI